MSTTETPQTPATTDLGGQHDGEREADAEPLEKDDIFHLLQNQRRRDSLRYLKAADDSVRMRDLAEQVAAWEHDTTLQALTSDQRQRVYIALYQSHLPKLDEEGIIEYNQSRGIVERTPRASQLDPYLETDGSDEDDRTESRDVFDKRGGYYGGVLGLSTLLLGGTALNLSLASLLTVVAVGVVALTAFTLLAMDFGSDE